MFGGMSSAPEYYWKWFKLAAWKAPTAAEFWTSVVSALIGILDHARPELGLLAGLGWQVPIWVLAFVMMIRILSAPYLIWKEQQDRISLLEVKNAAPALRFIRHEGDGDYEAAEFVGRGEGVLSRAIVKNTSHSNSIFAVDLRLVSIRNLESEVQNPMFRDLPRSLVLAPASSSISVPPQGVQGFALCRAGWDDRGAIGVMVAPGSVGQKIILAPGLYALKVSASGTDVARTPALFHVDTRTSAYSCELQPPTQYEV